MNGHSPRKRRKTDLGVEVVGQADELEDNIQPNVTSVPINGRRTRQSLPSNAGPVEVAGAKTAGGRIIPHRVAANRPQAVSIQLEVRYLLQLKIHSRAP